jgi:glycosyltransferase involved in cell wall biosynthesis
MKKDIELSIAIPFYNEEENVADVLKEVSKELKNNNINYELIAVNNGSIDKTKDIIKSFIKKDSNIKLVDIKKNIGYGFGITSGLNKASGKYIGYMWGDKQIESKVITEVFKRLKEKNLDVCKIKRIKRGDGILRKIQSKFYNYLLDLIFAIKTDDINGCPKIMKKEVYKNLNLQSKDWFIDTELMIKLHKRNCKIDEIPVIFKKREKGKSNIKITTIFEFIRNLLKYKFKK